jgi:integrase
MHVHRLTTAQIRHAKPGLLNDGGGLLLQTTDGKDGRRNQSWLFRYSLAETVISKNGKPRLRTRDMGLGPLATVSVTEAREKARQLRQQRLDGIDPIEHRKVQRGELVKQAARAKTFQEVALEYVRAHGVGWRNQKHATQWLGTLQRLAFPVIGKLPVGQVDTPLVLKILEPIWLTKTETAHRVRGRVENVLDYATAAQYRSGDNPASWAILEHLLPKPEKVKQVRHLDSLPYSHIADFMMQLRKIDSSAARALEFAVLTGTRSNEVLGARWDEIGADPETGVDVWTIPANRTKSHRELRVPLSTAAHAVLDRAARMRRDDFLFPGRVDGRGLGHNAMLQVIESLGCKVTQHGMRATFRTWAAERTGFPREIAEAALGHAVGSDTERSYQRGELLEKRRDLMEKWGEFCGTPFATTTATVTPIRARA